MITKWLVALVVILFPIISLSEETAPIIPVAILPFESGSDEFKDIAKQAPDLMVTLLSTDPSLMLVERVEIDKLLSEQELGLSGAITYQTAAKVGQLTGAKILVTGRIFGVENEKVFLAKIMGTETGRVFGEMVSSPKDQSQVTATQTLATKLLSTIKNQTKALVAPVVEEKDLIATLQKQIAGKKLPTVSVSVHETTISSLVPNPTVGTELSGILTQLGFTVVDPVLAGKPADITLTGQAVSDLGLRKANLVSAKGRVELKATNSQSGQILLSDKQVEVAIDLSDAIAQKSALEKAAKALAERIVPALLK